MLYNQYGNSHYNGNSHTGYTASWWPHYVVGNSHILFIVAGNGLILFIVVGNGLCPMLWEIVSLWSLIWFLCEIKSLFFIVVGKGLILVIVVSRVLCSVLWEIGLSCSLCEMVLVWSKLEKIFLMCTMPLEIIPMCKDDVKKQSLTKFNMPKHARINTHFSDRITNPVTFIYEFNMYRT